MKYRKPSVGFLKQRNLNLYEYFHFKIKGQQNENLLIYYSHLSRKYFSQKILKLNLRKLQFLLRRINDPFCYDHVYFLSRYK